MKDYVRCGTFCVTISEERYNELLEAEAQLDALHFAGVENWEGYEYALEVMEDNDDSL